MTLFFPLSQVDIAICFLWLSHASLFPFELVFPVLKYILQEFIWRCFVNSEYSVFGDQGALILLLILNDYLAECRILGLQLLTSLGRYYSITFSSLLLLLRNLLSVLEFFICTWSILVFCFIQDLPFFLFFCPQQWVQVGICFISLVWDLMWFFKDSYFACFGKFLAILTVPGIYCYLKIDISQAFHDVSWFCASWFLQSPARWCFCSIWRRSF